MSNIKNNDLLLVERSGVSYNIEYQDLQPVVSVKDFGATGNGNNDDTKAVNDALDVNGAIYFPPGTYKVTGKLAPVNRSIRIYGDGSQLSIIKFVNGGIDFTGTQTGGAGDHTCIIENIGIIGSGDAAVKIEYTTNGTLAQKAHCCDVAIKGSFTTGFDLINTDLSLFENSSVSSANVGYKLTETSTGTDPVNIKFTNCITHSCDIGIKVDAKAEGIYITNSLMFDCRVGIFVDASSFIDNEPVALGAEPFYVITGCNLDCWQTSIYLKSVMQSVISDNSFYKFRAEEHINANWTGLWMEGNSFDNIITDNIFNSTVIDFNTENGQVVGRTLTGINVVSCVHSVFSTNTYLSLDFGNTVSATSGANQFTNNKYRDVTNNISSTTAEILAQRNLVSELDETLIYNLINYQGVNVYDGYNSGGFRLKPKADDADKLDGLDSTSFLRSDATNSYDGSVYGRFMQFNCVTSQKGNNSSADLFPLAVYQPNLNSDAAIAFHIAGRFATYFGLTAATNDLFVGGWSNGAVRYKIWHEGNGGSGSGLDADKLDGLQSTSFLRGDDVNTNQLKISKAASQILLHAKSNTPTVSLRNDGGAFYILISAAGSSLIDDYNLKRPFAINLSTGLLSSANGQSFGGGMTTSGFLTCGSRVSAGAHSASNVAYQYAGRAGSGLGFPAAEDVALFANTTKVLAAKSNGTMYFGSASDDAMTPGTNNTKNGLRLESDGRFIQKRNSAVNTGIALLAGGNAGSLTVSNNGNCFNDTGRYEQASDERFKENVVDCKSQWEDIKALRWVNYNYKPETNMTSTTMLGVVAQEAEKVSPGLVSEYESSETSWTTDFRSGIGDTYKSVAYSVIAMKSAAALKESLIRIEELEAKVAALENK